MKSIQESSDNRKKHQMDADDRFSASLADNMRSLLENEKFMAKQSIRNVVYKYQLEKFNSMKMPHFSNSYHSFYSYHSLVVSWTMQSIFKIGLVIQRLI